MMLGADAHIPKSELKKIKAFNGLCGLWYSLMLLFTIANINTKFDGEFLGIPLHIGFGVTTLNIAMVIFTAFIQVLHYKRYLYTARLLLIVSIIGFNFIVANYADKSTLAEYFLIVAPAMSLIFFDSKTNKLCCPDGLLFVFCTAQFLF